MRGSTDYQLQLNPFITSIVCYVSGFCEKRHQER